MTTPRPLSVTSKEAYSSAVFRRIGGLAILALAPLSYAAVSAATTTPPSLNEAGPITSLTASGVTVQGDGQIPLSCSRTSGSPSVASFKVGETVMMACDQGVLARIARKTSPALGPTTSITGLPNRFAVGEPVPGPRPTRGQCAASWNTTAPEIVREAIAGMSPLGAQVVVGTAGVISPPPNTRTLTKGPVCEIVFVLAGQTARTVTVTSYWKDGKAEGWAGFLERSGARYFLSTDETAFAVSASGTLSLRFRPPQ